jgi:hypothetical protein
MTQEQMLYEPLPLFDCVFCAGSESTVLSKVLGHSLHRKFFEHFLVQSNNYLMPIPLGDRTLKKYDADEV